MNIMILGSTGFLGRKCVERLSVNNNITVVDVLQSCNKIKNVNYECIELADYEIIIQKIKDNNIEIVLHLISSLIPSSLTCDYVEDIKNIYIPSLKLLDYCSTNSVKFVYFSSGGAVYGNQHEKFNENTKREPVSLYGLSRLNFENAITFYHNTKGLQYLILRPANPYGPGQDLYGRQGIIAVIIGKILQNSPIEIWGDGTAIKDFIYIDDFVSYVELLLLSKESWNSFYNVGSGVGVSINEIIESFKFNNIALPPIKHIEQKKFDVSRMILDCTRIQQLFDYKCCDINTGIKKFYDFQIKVG